VTIAEQFTPRRRFTLLLLALLSMLFAPVLLPDELDGVIGPVLFTVVLLSALAAVANTRRRMAFATAFAIPGCGLMVAASFVHTPSMISASSIVATLFLIYAAAAILDFVFRAHRVDASVILGSLCVYILMAVIWGEFYGLIQLHWPGSLMLPPTDSARGIRSLLEYFSFVTITTVGYGEIYPVSPLARATAATEALIGQLYLVVLVARLVGLHTAQEAREKSEKS